MKKRVRRWWYLSLRMPATKESMSQSISVSPQYRVAGAVVPIS